MGKLVFWLKNVVFSDKRGCNGICLTCKHYNICSVDGIKRNKKKREILEKDRLKEKCCG